MKNYLLLLLLCTVCVSIYAEDTAREADILLKQIPPNTITYKSPNGWLYSKNELIHLSKGALENGRIKTVAVSRKPINADPFRALKAFHDDLAVLGIKLIIVPVPPKLAAVPCNGITSENAMRYLKPYYQELRSKGLNILDISEHFKKNATSYYCKTDAHWSPLGIKLTVKLLAEEISFRGNTIFKSQKIKQKISGDLAKSLNPNAAETEEILLEKVAGNTIDSNSPILLIGDSHTLIFSTGDDMLANNAGLAELLALELKTPIDRIGVRGSAATAVRINLFRKAAKNQAWLKNKKYVIYCFSCREFTEATSGWVKVPVLRK